MTAEPIRPPDRRLRVGVVGCGLVAQVVHLPCLQRLADYFETVALCDLAADLVDRVADRWNVPLRYSTIADLLDQELDAVMILTSGPHEQMVRDALQAGAHVFVEKPFCFDPTQGENVVQEAVARGLTVMVGCQKRYDPAFDLAAEKLRQDPHLTLIRSTTLEGSLAASLGAHDILKSSQRARPSSPKEWPELAAALPGAPALIRRAYADCMLESMVHDVNLVRGLSNEPLAVQYAAVRRDGGGVSAHIRVGDRIDWIALWHSFPELDRYHQTFAFHSSTRQVQLKYASPFQRDAPPRLSIEESDPESEKSSAKNVTASFRSPYQLQLQHFYHCVVDGERPRTGAADGVADVRLLQDIAVVAMSHDSPGLRS
jgi:predicted dehydrogenase